MTDFKNVPVFDIPLFLADVEAYRTRHEISVVQMAAECGMAFSSMYETMSGGSELTLFMACTLADFADLSLDKYRKVLNLADA